jgi:hypothetical protein
VRQTPEQAIEAPMSMLSGSQPAQPLGFHLNVSNLA